MRNQEVNLSQSQQQFLKAFLAQAGKEAIGKKFGLLVDPRNQRYLEWENITIPLTLSLPDLRDLVHREYIQINVHPVSSIVFTEKVQELFAETRAPEESHNGRKSDPINQIRIVQVYAWLIASLVAALFFLFLVWLTVQQALQQHVSAIVVSAILDAGSAALTVVFFKQWNQANQYLNDLRSGPPAIKSQETDK